MPKINSRKKRLTLMNTFYIIKNMSKIESTCHVEISHGYTGAKVRINEKDCQLNHSENKCILNLKNFYTMSLGCWPVRSPQCRCAALQLPQMTSSLRVHQENTSVSPAPSLHATTIMTEKTFQQLKTLRPHECQYRLSFFATITLQIAFHFHTKIWFIITLISYLSRTCAS